jgi:hypothetical protein
MVWSGTPMVIDAEEATKVPSAMPIALDIGKASDRSQQVPPSNEFHLLGLIAKSKFGAPIIFIQFL